MRLPFTQLFRRQPPATETLKAALDEHNRREAERRRYEDILQRQQAALSIAAEQLAVDRLHEESERSGLTSFIAEMIEAKRMQGPGPWQQPAASMAEAKGLMQLADWVASGRRGNPPIPLQEAQLPGAVGAFGDINLALQNVEWRREINFSWLEFSHWGIQQLMLISRLYYIKNPIVRRLVDVCAAYVFARGVEVSTDDDAANDVIKAFFEANRQCFGHVALMRTERAKDTDGNVFWVLFPDRVDTGTVQVRTIDPIEIQEIVCNPEDSDEPWYYFRVWTENALREDGTIEFVPRKAWYPSLGYYEKTYDMGDQRPPTMRNDPIAWASPIYHRKCGDVGKWRFGCPRIYPMLDWAKESRRFLEACMSVRQALSQIALVITSKGGAQALQGLKQAFETTVGPSTQVWDTNPSAVPGGMFASGPGTTVEAFKTQGAGFDPEGVRQYKLMCCMVKGVPETFLADVSTGNLATATTLDRPTETAMMQLQEEWCEDLTVITQAVLRWSLQAPSGKLREGVKRLGVDPDRVKILEAKRVYKPNGTWHYEVPKVKALKVIREASGDAPADVEPLKVKVDFPNIREGDVPALVGAWVEAMTLGNKGGLVVGIDEKVGVTGMAEVIGVENAREMAEKMYPAKEYDPDRTKEIEPPPIGKVQPTGGAPQNPGGNQVAPPPPGPPPSREAQVRWALRRVAHYLKLWEAEKAAGDE
jgi:hypothetical protein